jgi:hypothetical protein
MWVWICLNAVKNDNGEYLITYSRADFIHELKLSIDDYKNRINYLRENEYITHHITPPVTPPVTPPSNKQLTCYKILKTSNIHDDLQTVENVAITPPVTPPITPPITPPVTPRKSGSQTKIKTQSNNSTETSQFTLDIDDPNPIIPQATVVDVTTLAHTECKNYFIQFYNEKCSVPYYFAAKDGKALSELLKRIKSSMTSKNFECNEHTLYDTFSMFIKCAWERSPYTRKTFTLPYINMQYNEICSNIHSNGQQSTNHHTDGRDGNYSNLYRKILNKN